jgi:CYTH domain-containing protein
MDKIGRTEIQRLFLIEGLPEPLTRATAHLQYFDNYVTGTRLRLRSIRNPETKEWTHVLQQRRFASEGDLSQVNIAEIFLDETEHEQLKAFEGNEIRKNRYFHEVDGRMTAFDVFLGPLWGLNIAKIEFDSLKKATDFEAPFFALFEITDEPFFDGGSLYDKKFDDVQAAVERLEPLAKGIEDRNID